MNKRHGEQNLPQSKAEQHGTSAGHSGRSVDLGVICEWGHLQTDD